MELWIALSSSVVLSNLVLMIGNFVTLRMNRKSQKDDRYQTIVRAQKVILQDRIRYLCKGYIKDGKIDMADRGDLIGMHDIYHTDLGGNGHLDDLMEKVKDLPLK